MNLPASQPKEEVVTMSDVLEDRYMIHSSGGGAAISEWTILSSPDLNIEDYVYLDTALVAM